MTLAESTRRHSTEPARAEVSLALAQVVSVGRSAHPALEAVTHRVREGSDPHVMIDALNALGCARLLLSEPARAQDVFAQSAELAGDHGDEVGEVHALVGLGNVAVLVGRYGDAEDALLPGLSLARAVGEGGAAALALMWLGEGARLQGKDDVARAWFVQAVDEALVVEHPEAKARALIGLGRLGAQGGERPIAGRMFEDALATARGASLPYLVAPALCGLAELTTEPNNAESLASEALHAAQSWGDREGEALALEHLGRLRRRQGT